MTRKQRHAILIAGGLATIGISLTCAMGEEPAISKAPATPAVVQAPPLDAMVERLEARLKQNGGDVNGWVMLVKSLRRASLEAPKRSAVTSTTIDDTDSSRCSEAA